MEGNLLAGGNLKHGSLEHEKNSWSVQSRNLLLSIHFKTLSPLYATPRHTQPPQLVTPPMTMQPEPAYMALICLLTLVLSGESSGLSGSESNKWFC